MATRIIYNEAEFLKSAAELKDLPQDTGNEVAFIGRSNAGKSSAINSITRKGLARTSKTPGRTQLINLFKLDDENRLVDLPGYGYTKAPASVSKRWAERTNVYLETRACLRGLVLVTDVRHPLNHPNDRDLIDWAIKCELPLHILLTKADKLKRGPALNAMQQVQQELGPHKKLISMQLFSSHDKTGLGEIYAKLNDWLMLLL